jgi:hypothetical protein
MVVDSVFQALLTFQRPGRKDRLRIGIPTAGYFDGVDRVEARPLDATVTARDRRVNRWDAWERIWHDDNPSRSILVCSGR